MTNTDPLASLDFATPANVTPACIIPRCARETVALLRCPKCGNESGAYCLWHAWRAARALAARGGWSCTRCGASGPGNRGLWGEL